MASLTYEGNQQRMTVTLGSAYTVADGVLALTAGHGARLPSSGDFWIKPTATAISAGATYQVWKCTARSTDTLTVTPAQDGTTDTNASSGTELEWTLGKAAFDQFRSDLSQAGTIASVPTTNLKDGILYRHTDGILSRRYDGAAWEYYKGGNLVTPPASADFSTWVNQGSATGTFDDEGLFLTSPGAAGVNIRGLFNSLPSDPYTITTGIIPAIINEPNTVTAVCGVALRNSSSGSLVIYNVGMSAGTGYSALVQKYTDATTFSATYAAYETALGVAGQPIWIKVEDNSTNRIWSLSYDGKNFIQVHSVSRTDFITPDQYGFIVYENNASALDIGLTAFHALEE